ncbi:MAG: acyl-CoA dehydrogenase family protein [Hydrogenibacillus schlegelii]|uniref:Acyl-CoA dehydrogenase family protein n=1 Tax=Hydrogenibacillus schlegelii TaxID=1484 RepID=A0A947CYQ9_HYDSH|nr:acyl-CoA dehydrogenase family protein [Hydrogenibacillus schlegelii]
MEAAAAPAPAGPDWVARARELARAFAETAGRYDREGAFPHEHFERLKAAGFFRLTVPRDFGGEEASLTLLLQVLEALAWGDGSTALALGWHLGLILHYRASRRWPEERFRELCRAVVEEAALINHFSTEPATGSPSRGGLPETKAVPVPGGFRLYGRKTFGTLSAVARFFVVTATVADGGATASGGEAAVLAAREAGFVHLSLDLIYGLPGQTFEGWTADVRRAFGLPIDHLSAYALEVAEATRFGRMQAAGALPLPDDDRVVEMYAFVAAAARDAGFEPYEVSNFARPGGRSRHNLAYWNNRPYFGFGPGAHGYAFGVRTANVPSLPRYARARTLSEFRTEVRPVGRREAIEETMFLGLRLAEGVRRDAFRRRFGVDLEDVYGPVLRRLEAEGLIVIDARGIRLPEAVRPVMNAVLAEFLFDDR